MQEPNQSKIRKIQSTLASIDLDIKLLRLRTKAGFNPNQPRVSAGSPDGGQWTDSDSTQRNARQRPTSSPARDDARISTQFGRGNSISNPQSRHTVTLPSGAKFVFETEGPTQTIFDGKGKPFSKAIWTPAGPESLPVVQQTNTSARQTVEAFDAARQLYNRLTVGNSPEHRACLAFTAKEFKPNSILPIVNFVGMLSRADAAAVCSRLDTVQRLADEATVEARGRAPIQVRRPSALPFTPD